MIEHRYKPSVGGSVQTSLGAPYAVKEPWYDEYKRKYCLDADFFATIDRLRKAANSAEAIAWETPYPLLVFPCLFDERAREIQAADATVLVS